MNSTSNSGELISIMFPDSDIAKQFQCGHTKAGHVTHFGLVPYIHELILSKLSDCMTVCFYHVTYAFQSESTLYSCLNVKELLA